MSIGECDKLVYVGKRRVSLLLLHVKYVGVGTFGLSFVVLHDGDAGHGTELGTEFLEVVIGDLRGQVLDVDVGPGGGLLGFAVLAGTEVSNVDNLVSELHLVHHLDGVLGGLGRLKVDETISLGLLVGVEGDLAGENVSKDREGVVQLFVTDFVVKVLDEDVTNTRLADGGVTLRPHDAARTALDGGVVESVQSTFGCSMRPP